MASRTLEVRITGVDAGGKKVLTGFAAEAESVGRKMQSVGKKMSIGLTAPLLLAARAAFQEMTGAQAATAQTNATIKSTGGVANVTTKEVQDLSAALMAKSGVDDELVQSGANLLLTFRNIRNEVGKGNDVFDRATTAALDLSTAGFGDMASTSKMLGKALNDPIAGINAMSRAGVTFSAEQKTLIRRLVETGDLLGAQKIILKEIETQVGGSAEAYGKTLAGSVGKAREALLNAAGSILSTAGPAFDVITSGAQTFAGVMEGLPGPVKGLVAALGGVLAVAGPVLYIAGGMARNFAALQETATGAKMLSGLGRLSGALKGLGIIGVATAAFYAAGDALGLFDKITSGVTLSVKRLQTSSGMKEIAADLRDLVGAQKEYERTSKELEGIANSTVPSMLFTLKERYNDLAGSFRKIVKESPEAAQTFIDQAVAAGLPAKEIERLQGIMERNTVTQAELDTAALSTAQRLKAEGQEAKLTAEQIQRLNDAVNQGVNAQLGVEGALLNVESAQARYNQAVTDSGVGSLQAREAQLALQQSYIATSEAIMANADANRDGKVSADEAKAATQKQIETLSFMAAGLAPGSPLRVFLDQYISQLRTGIPTAVSTELQVKVDAAIANLQRYIDKYNALDPAIKQKLAWLIPMPRAEGGPVDARSPYIVGERGPELFVPDVSGQIIPNHKLGSGGGTSLAAGGGVVVNLYADNIVNDRQFEDLVANAILSARRSGVAV